MEVIVEIKILKLGSRSSRYQINEIDFFESVGASDIDVYL